MDAQRPSLELVERLGVRFGPPHPGRPSGNRALYRRFAGIHNEAVGEPDQHSESATGRVRAWSTFGETPVGGSSNSSCACWPAHEHALAPRPQFGYLFHLPQDRCLARQRGAQFTLLGAAWAAAARPAEIAASNWGECALAPVES